MRLAQVQNADRLIGLLTVGYRLKADSQQPVRFTRFDHQLMPSGRHGTPGFNPV